MFTDSHVVMLECPNCGHLFPAVPLTSSGWCKCGMDWAVDMKTLTLKWSPDPKYTPDAEPSEIPLVVETWPE